MHGPTPILPIIILALVVLGVLGWVVLTVFSYTGHAAG